MLTVLKTITVRGLAVLLVSGLLVPNGQAVETMSAGVLLSSCKSVDADEAPSMDICHAYIKGYVDAIVGLTLAHPGDESFQQRALKTRARGQILQDGIMIRSPYCLPTDLPLSDVVEKLEREKVSISENASAAELLSSTLKKHYTCP